MKSGSVLLRALVLMPSRAEGTPLFLAQKRPKLWEYAGDTLGILLSLNPPVTNDLVFPALG
jgi:hypothetical protein